MPFAKCERPKGPKFLLVPVITIGFRRLRPEPLLDVDKRTVGGHENGTGKELRGRTVRKNCVDERKVRSKLIYSRIGLVRLKDAYIANVLK